MSSTLDDRIQGVEAMLGFDLHSYQRQALEAIGQGKDVILHVPTGGGKTAALQGAPYVSPHQGITVILYPLRALVKDQTRRFEAAGFPSVTLYGETPIRERPIVYNKILDGSARYILTTPESFDMNRKLQEVLTKRGVSVLIVDEAHAYEEWADGFRPVYRRIGAISQKVGVKQFLLCSATLTEKGFRTASKTIGKTNWTIVQVPPIRSNLIYKNLSQPSDEILARAIRGNGLEAPGIVFFTTVKCLTETAARVGQRSGKRVLCYHGSMSGKERRIAQDTFMDEDVWIFATKAFGMGIDKGNIRNIIHCQLPNSILSYAQEVGRAGRDGYEAGCYLTQDETGQAAHFLTSISVPSIGQVRRVWNLLQAIALNWAGWFEVDWQQVADRTKMYLPAVQACVSWLFTGRMIEKAQKRLSWKFKIHEDSDEMAIKYKRKTPEILDILRGEAMVGQGASEFILRPEVLADSVGQLFSGWRAKLRKMNELGIISIEEPPKGRSRYRFLHSEFRFEHGTEQLEGARKSAFACLSAMQKLQIAPPSKRRAIIEDAISLKLDLIAGAEIIDTNFEAPLAPKPRPKVKPKMVVTSEDDLIYGSDDSPADDDGDDEWSVSF
jgi:RecQ family ATP-dependent DNA helicase